MYYLVGRKVLEKVNAYPHTYTGKHKSFRFTHIVWLLDSSFAKVFSLGCQIIVWWAEKLKGKLTDIDIRTHANIKVLNSHTLTTANQAERFGGKLTDMCMII